MLVSDQSIIPEKSQIGLFTAKLWHPGQNKKETVPVCSNCLKQGHRKVECKSPMVCLACKQEGHRKGECPIEPIEEGDNTTQSAILPHTEEENKIAMQVADLLQQVRRGTPPTRGKGLPPYRTPTSRKRGKPDTSRDEKSTKKKDGRRTPLTAMKKIDDGWSTDHSDAEVHPQEPNAKPRTHQADAAQKQDDLPKEPSLPPSS